jgi:hypothetical protein
VVVVKLDYRRSNDQCEKYKKFSPKNLVLSALVYLQLKFSN